MATETPTATKTATAATIILPTPTLVGMDTVTPIPLFPWVQSASQMCSPLGGITIYELVDIVSAPYTGPPPGSDDRHEGVDFAYYNRGEKQSIEGVSVNSILPGRVVSVIKNRAPYGNMVIVETGYKDVAKDLAGVFSITPQKSLYHLYAHMKNTPAVVMGQTVGCGDIIGEVGSTGTNVSHLHFETRYGPPGGWFPVMGFFDLDATEEEKSNYVYWRTSWTYQHFNPMDIITAYEKYLESK
ncbi:MAG: M23 family metallopeptidase [Chloroflexota bacterium]